MRELTPEKFEAPLLIDNRRWTGVDALVFIALGALVIIAFWEVAGGGRVFFFRDFSFFFYPKRLLVAERLRNFDIPFWTQYAGGGEPLLGTYQVAMFYPLALIYYLLPMPQSFMWFVVLHFVVAGSGSYYLMRKFGARRGAAAFAGVAWALSPALVSVVDNVSFMNTLAWLPWCLAFTRKLSLGGGFRAFFWLVVTFAMAVLAGGPEPVIFIVGIVAGYTIIAALARCFRFGWRGAWHAPVLTAAALFLALVICGVELAPFAHALRWSYRGEQKMMDAQIWSAKPSDALLWFLPRFYLFADRGGIYWRSQYWLKTVYMGVMVPVLAGWTFLFMRRHASGRIKVAWAALAGLFGAFFTTPFGSRLYGMNIGKEAVAKLMEVHKGQPPTPAQWYILAAAIGFVLFSVIGLLLASTRRRNVFFVLVAGVAMLLAIGLTSTLWQVLWMYLPGFRLIRFPVKWVLPAAFAMSVLAGFAVDDAMVAARARKRGRLYSLLGMFLVLALVFGAGWFVMKSRPAETFRAITPPGISQKIAEGDEDAEEQAQDQFWATQWSLGRSSAYLLGGLAALSLGVIITSRRIPRPYGGIALVLVIYLDIALFGAHLNPVSGPETYTERPSHLEFIPHGPVATRLYSTPQLNDYVRERRLTRIADVEGLIKFIGMVKGRSFQNDQEVLRWVDRTGIPRMASLDELDQWLQTTNSPQFIINVEQEVLKEVFHPNLNLLYGVHSIDSFDPLAPRWHYRYLEMLHASEVPLGREAFIAELLGASHVVDAIPGPPGFRYIPLSHPGRRALLADHILPARDDDAALEFFVNSDEDLTRRIVLLQEDADEALAFLGPASLEAPADDHEAPGTAWPVSDKGDRSVYKVDAKRRAVVFIADNWYPNFRATIDGKPTEIWRANHGYRALPVEPGRHTIVFEYVATEFYVGLGMTLFGILVLVVVWRLWPKAARAGA